MQSNAQGQFSIDIDSKSQLHISKDNYLDSRISLENTDNTIDVTLKPTSVETVVVYASALHKNSLEMISPVSVLSGDELKIKLSRR